MAQLVVVAQLAEGFRPVAALAAMGHQAVGLILAVKVSVTALLVPLSLERAAGQAARSLYEPKSEQM